MKRAASDITVINQWRFLGGGGGVWAAALPPLSLDQTEARKAEKKFLGDPSPSPYLKVWIRHCKGGNWETKFHDFYKVACVASVSVQFRSKGFRSFIFVLLAGLLGECYACYL